MIAFYSTAKPTISIILLFGLILYLLGNFVLKYKLHVGYSRKISHFSMLIIPQLIFQSFGILSSIDRILISFVSSLSLFSILSFPIRSKLQFANKMHIAIDRPEDRPYTLRWLISQTIIAYLILLILSKLFELHGMPLELLYITIFVVAIGDGLAEPIGIRFGNHKYSTKGFLVNKTYTRSLEGSACVFFFSIIFLVLYRNYFSFNQLMLLLFLYPIALTLIEAKSPHTWDTPFLFIAGNLLIYLIWSI